MNTNFKGIGVNRLGIKLESTALEADVLTTRPSELLEFYASKSRLGCYHSAIQALTPRSTELLKFDANNIGLFNKHNTAARRYVRFIVRYLYKISHLRYYVKVFNE